MAKVGKLTKLKSAIKRWPSFTKQLSFSCSSSSHAAIAATATEPSSDNESEELHVVYVGKSRRRYFLSSDVIFHPLFRELVERSASGGSGEYGGGEAAAVVVACEVVLFEHLIWMINESASGGGGGEAQLGSMQELVEFYTC